MEASLAHDIIPANDEHRLRALRFYEILNTGNEEVFDNLAQMMTQVFGTPMAFISLVDKDRVYYKAQAGAFGRDSVPREDSLCSHAILQREPLIVENAPAEAFLAGNPFVAAEDGIRFYAGAPLVTAEGYHIGTACVVDLKPRSFSEAETKLLTRFARLAMQQIEMRRSLLYQHEAEEMLQQANRELRFVTDNVPQLVWATEPDGYSYFFNKGWLHYTGLAFDDVKGDGWMQSLHPDDRNATVAAWHGALENGGTYDVEYRLRRHDGVYRWFVARGTPMRDEQGHIVKWYGTTTDIEEQKRTHADLQQAKERFDLVSKATQDAIWDWNLRTNDIWWNDGFKEMFGYKAEEIEPTIDSWYSRVHPDDKERVIGGIHRVIDNGGKQWADEYRFRKRDGSYAVVFDRGHALHDANGVPYRMLGSMQDVTEQKTFETTLAESEKRFRTLTQNSPDLITRHGKDFRYLYASPLIETLTGVPPQDFIGKTYYEVPIPQELCPVFDEHLGRVFKTGKPHQMEYAANTGGNDVHLFSRLVPEFDEKGEIVSVLVISTDVTERKKAEAGLMESEKRFQAAVAAVQGILWTNNAQGEMEGEQPGWHELTGQTFEEYQGYGWSKAVHPDDAGATVAAWQDALRERKTFVFEHRVKTKAGTWRLFSVRAIPVLRSDGTIKEWVGVHTDVTDERAAEEKVRQSEQRFQNLVREASVGIVILTGDDVYIEVVNDAYARLIGRRADELIHRPIFEIVPEAEEPFRKVIDGVRTSGEPFYLYDQPYTVFDGNGKEISGYLNIVYQPYKEVDGTTTGVMVLCQDVTMQVEARNKIAEAEETARLAIASAELGTFNVNLKTNAMTASGRLDEIFDVEHQSERGRYVEAIHPEDRTVREKAYEQAYKDGLLEYESRVVRKSGAVRWIRVKGVITFDDARTPLKLVGVVQDITEEKEFADELTRKVQERTQELEQFTYVSHHDLQEPLRKIIMFTDMVRSDSNDQLSESARNRLDKVVTAARRMSAALRDVLNFASLRKEEMFADVDLDETLAAVQTDLELAIADRKARLQSDELPTIKAVPQQMHQLFYNLVNNALKFSRTDRQPVVTVSCTVLGDAAIAVHPELSPGRRYYQISVQDNGIGFDPQAADKIFVLFQRLHTRDAYAGTGIGLALCKKVVVSHGGKIWAESKVGEGASFNIILPA